MLSVIGLKTRYLASTSPHLRAIGGESVQAGLESIATESAWLYRDGTASHSEHFHNNLLAAEDVEPHADLAIIGATCLLKLAGLDPIYDLSKASRLQGIRTKYVLQAVMWLDFHFRRNPRGSSSLRILLSKLCILLGCTRRAEMIWDSLEVKNVTLDSLGPIFSDRLSTITPGRMEALIEYRNFYNNAFKRSLPNNIKNATSTANYSSILGLMDTSRRLQQSCTLAMTVTEGLRSRRFAGDWSTTPIFEDKLLRPSMSNFC
jgi:N-terminal acetyltransferase B complex non-catalytic subunit